MPFFLGKLNTSFLILSLLSITLLPKDYPKKKKNPLSENPMSLGLLNISMHRCLHPRDKKSNWMVSCKKHASSALPLA